MGAAGLPRDTCRNQAGIGDRGVLGSVPLNALEGPGHLHSGGSSRSNLPAAGHRLVALRRMHIHTTGKYMDSVWPLRVGANRRLLQV